MTDKKKTDNSTSSSARGILEILLTIFITLKLIPGTSVNDWSWWWVLSPLWIPLALAAAVYFVAFLYFICMNVGKK